MNSAIEINLTGQVVADSIGKYAYSGISDQLGVPRIVPTIAEGAGVVTTRAHRAIQLRDVAHPDDRDSFP
ncbi:hypothetical protein T492DRAFT_863954 [Pavlovales sp. CCMP2436]|nr:hypothetical protein T492DRAFT_863954 [Pavlovales sp. CCMP2436]